MTDQLALALVRRLVALGVLEAPDITATADELTAAGHIAESLAVNVAFIEGQAEEWPDTPCPTPLRLVHSVDGGNG